MSKERVPNHDHSGFNEGGKLALNRILSTDEATSVSGGGGSTSSGAGLIVEEGGAVTVAAAAALNFNATDFNVTDEGGGVAGVALGTSTGSFELNIEGGQDVIKAHGSMGSTETFDPTDGNVHTGTLNANCTFTLSAPSGSGAASLEFWLTEDGTGGWAVTWPGSVTETGSHNTTASTTQRVLVESIDGGTSWVASWEGSAAGVDLSAIDFLVGTASGDLSAEIVVGTTPGGELGNTWASPTVDTTHSGSSHASIQAAAEATAAAALAAALLTVATGGAHAHVASETHLSDGSTTTWTLDQNFEPGSVIAWNVTTLARLTVTEVVPDQATVSAAGTTGDSIVFDYAATIA